jgi:hypothetical protein
MLDHLARLVVTVTRRKLDAVRLAASLVRRLLREQRR